MNSFNFSTIPIFYRHFSKWGEFNSKTTTNAFLSAMSLRRTSNDQNSCPSLLRQNLDKQDSSNVKKILPKKSSQKNTDKKFLPKDSTKNIPPKIFFQKNHPEKLSKISKKFQKIQKISRQFLKYLANAKFGQCDFFPEPKVALGKDPLYVKQNMTR